MYCTYGARGVELGVKPVLIIRAPRGERALEKSGIYFILPGYFHLIKFHNECQIKCKVSVLAE